jgi:hypothetical protein
MRSHPYPWPSVLKGSLTMLQSHVIDVDRAPARATVRLDKGYRFITTDMKLDNLEGSIFPAPTEVQRLARRIYPGGRMTSSARTY